jgi:hypothetical protein
VRARQAVEALLRVRSRAGRVALAAALLGKLPDEDGRDALLEVPPPARPGSARPEFHSINQPPTASSSDNTASATLPPCRSSPAASSWRGSSRRVG